MESDLSFECSYDAARITNRLLDHPETLPDIDRPNQTPAELGNRSNARRLLRIIAETSDPPPGNFQKRYTFLKIWYTRM